MLKAGGREIFLNLNALDVCCCLCVWESYPFIYKPTGKLECHPRRHDLKESLCLYYYLRKTEQESEIAQEFNELVEPVPFPIGKILGGHIRSQEGRWSCMSVF